VAANIRSKGPLGALYPHPCCILEGDTPTFLGLIDNGLASAMSPAFGGWGGRYIWWQPRGESARSGRRAAGPGFRIGPFASAGDRRKAPSRDKAASRRRRRVGHRSPGRV
jgi:hypothetical protein